MQRQDLGGAAAAHCSVRERKELRAETCCCLLYKSEEEEGRGGGGGQVDGWMMDRWI